MIKLSDEFLEESELGEGRLSSASSQKDLRSCVSEPILRLNDSVLMEDMDDTQSCESDMDRAQVVVRPLRLDSIGSSNGSSYGSAADDSYGCGLDFERSNEQLRCDGLVEPFPGKGSETDGETSEAFGKSQHNGGNLHFKEVNHKPRDSKLVACQRLQSGSDGERKVKEGGSPLQKSCSIEGACEVPGLTPVMSQLEPGGRERNPSMQTLVADEGVIEEAGEVERVSGNHRGGGDSGIDPGEVDVFKFPPRQQSSKPLTMAEYPGNSGDHTPIGCTSPEPRSSLDVSGCGQILFAKHEVLVHDNNVKKASPSTPVASSCSTPNLQACVGSNERDGPIEAGGMEAIANPSPTHSNFSHSRTSSTDACPDISLLVTRERSQSPMGQSWASSEFSFTLPHPSTPLAPPSSPVHPHSRHSVPSSPQYRHSPYNTPYRHRSPKYRGHPPHHRYSAQEIPHLPPCLQKTNSLPHRPSSCRNSAGSKFDSFEEPGSGNRSMVADLQVDFERMMKLTKTVHFVDSHYDDDGDDYDSNMSFEASYAQKEARQRSRSSPSRSVRKSSAPDRKNGKFLREYGISLKTDLLDFDTTCSSKYYKITQTSHTRLSSSTPDLSKLSLYSAP